MANRPALITEQDLKAILEEARKAYHHAYAPYSRYQVGAAVLADDGHIYSGANVENAVYPLTICAERVAIASAIAAGARQILAVAVVTSSGGTPCGACRQVMREFATEAMQVVIADLSGSSRTRALGELLPESFSSTDLS